MKIIITIVAILFCLVSFGQTKTATRTVNGYTVTYTYDTTCYSFGHERQARVQYFCAKIQVVEVASRNKVGQEITGVYSPDASMKDDPAVWIDKAKNPKP